MSELAFPKSARLLTSADFDQVFKNATFRAGNDTFLLLACCNQLQRARIGFVIGKRNVKLAVTRNQLKRVIREEFRLNDDLPAIDIVVLVRRKINAIENLVIRTKFIESLRKLNRKADHQPRSKIRDT